MPVSNISSSVSKAASTESASFEDELPFATDSPSESGFEVDDSSSQLKSALSVVELEATTPDFTCRFGDWPEWVPVAAKNVDTTPESVEPASPFEAAAEPAADFVPTADPPFDDASAEAAPEAAPDDANAAPPL